MSRFGNNEMEDEMAQARQKHKAREAAEHRADQVETERMWRDNERRRQGAHGPRSGRWTFEELQNTSGVITGWGAYLNGHLEGMLVIRGNDLLCLASGDSDRGDPSSEEILRVFAERHPR